MGPEGTVRLLAAADSVPDDALAAPSLLPGWSRAHLLAHVAANADALGRLAHWAATGVETPMYASAAARESQIQTGARLGAPELRAWLAQSAAALLEQLDRLEAQQWSAQVVTAQRRRVSATEIPWLRTREVWVHAVDLDAGVGFADLPAEVLEALAADIRRSRARDGRVPPVNGDPAQVVAWLAGRPTTLTDDRGAPVPDLPPWL